MRHAARFDNPKPSRSEVELPVASREDAPTLARDARLHALAITLGHELEHTIDLIGACDPHPVRVLRRKLRAADPAGRDDPDLAEQAHDAVGEFVADRSPFEDDARSAVHEGPG